MSAQSLPLIGLRSLRTDVEGSHLSPVVLTHLGTSDVPPYTLQSRGIVRLVFALDFGSSPLWFIWN